MIKRIKGKLGITALEQRINTLEKAGENLREQAQAHEAFVLSSMAELKAYTRVDGGVKSVYSRRC